MVILYSAPCGHRDDQRTFGAVATDTITVSGATVLASDLGLYRTGQALFIQANPSAPGGVNWTYFGNTTGDLPLSGRW
jgi:hypothetical protein